MENKEMVLKVAATEEEMDTVCGFVDDILAEIPFSIEEKTKLDMAVEEIFVNIYNYAYGEGTGQVVIKGVLSLAPPYTLTVVFEDRGVEFNPLARETPDLTPDVRRRTVGGLGIFLARSMADEISYERRDGKNILTVRKNMV